MGQFLQGGKNGRLMSFLDALASLKTMLDIKWLSHWRFQDFKSTEC